MKTVLKIAIVGGSGYWTDRNHNKHILELKPTLPIELSVIIDPINPQSVAVNENTIKLCTIDKTAWLDPRNFESTDELVLLLKDKFEINLVIISSSPCTHFEYGISCLKYGINVICDKPILSSTNASSSIQSASSIREKYNKLLESYHLAKKKNPNLLFHSILRRRSLESYTKVANELNKVYEKTRAGINSMTILISSGVSKFPAELINPGAHGYLDGIGAFSHSAYHYVDALAWFVSKAPGEAIKIIPSLNYVFRIKDYLNAKSYESIANAIKVNKAALIIPQLSEETLACELNVGFTLSLLSRKNIPVGTISFLYNHLSFSTRVNDYDKEVREPGDHKGGGRMSQSIIDVHQSGLQNWQIFKNDIALTDNTITVQGRRHASMDGEKFEFHKYENAYHAGISMKDLFEHVIKTIMEDKGLEGHSIIRELPEERLAVDIYASCYELIAGNYKGEDTPNSEILL
jgi:hypothetical protein